MRRAGHLADVLGCAITLADIQITQGRLGDAMRTYEQSAASSRPPRTGRCSGGPRTCTSGLSTVHRERNDLDAATQHLLRSQELGEHIGLPQNPLSLAGRDGPASGRPKEISSGALELLDEAERVYDGDFSPNVRPGRRRCGRGCGSRQGELDEALGWARERGCPPTTT